MAQKRGRESEYVEPKPVYIIRDGYRFVQPYVYEFKTFTKGRWLGKPVLELFLKEFAQFSPEYYKAALAKGLLRVNGEPVSADYKLKNADAVSHLTHRHEPPVSADPVVIVHNDDELIVVNKPCTYPIHPCGSYRHNCLCTILEEEHGLKNLFLIHRLDRLTSGLVLFGKSSQVAGKLAGAIREREMHKMYLARVTGKFPEQAALGRPALGTAETKSEEDEKLQEERTKYLKFLPDGAVEVSVPILCINEKMGVHAPHADGKPATTVFRLRSYNGKTSCLECEPLTGRTHQIRVHLQWLGHAIANDPNYGGVPDYGFAQPPDDPTVIHDAAETKEQAASDPTATAGSCDVGSLSMEAAARSLCPFCANNAYERKHSEPQHLGIWLHALRYKNDEYNFSVPEPAWAADSWAL